MQARAFAPGHITGLFEIHWDENPRRSGSKGAGFSLEAGVLTRVRAREGSDRSIEVTINGVPAPKAQVSRLMARRLLGLHGRASLKIEHIVAPPIGAGFGTSAAAALSLALATNEALGLGLKREELVALAHEVEVEARTGLGTVMAIDGGRFELRIRPGGPGYGRVLRIEPKDEDCCLALCLGAYPTKKALGDARMISRINGRASELLPQLERDFTVGNFLEASKAFTEGIGLAHKGLMRALRELEKLTGLTWSLAMFGKTLFTLARWDEASELVEKVRRLLPRGELILCNLDGKGARLL